MSRSELEIREFDIDDDYGMFGDSEVNAYLLELTGHLPRDRYEQESMEAYFAELTK